MCAASTDHALGAAREAGVDATVPAALAALFGRGVAAGHGAESFTSLIEVLRKPAA